jgi:hypothetical protein
MKHVIKFDLFESENVGENAKSAAESIIEKIKKIEDKNGKTTKIEKRSGGVAVVSWMGRLMSDVLFKIYDDRTVALNKNAIEPGGKYKFNNFNDVIDFCVWYYKEKFKVHDKAGSGDNSKLAAEFKAEVIKKTKQ